MSDYEKIVNAMSRIIAAKRRALDDECTRPRGNPDASDHFITQERARVKELIDVRDRFETIMCASSTEGT